MTSWGIAKGGVKQNIVHNIRLARLALTLLKQAKAIVVSSGFAEIGNVDLQDKIVNIARRYGMRILGPNCFGLINTMLDLDLTFSFTRALKGSIAFISQSGAMCCGTLDYAYQQDIGFSKFVNLGNKCDVDEADIISYQRSDI